MRDYNNKGLPLPICKFYQIIGLIKDTSFTIAPGHYYTWNEGKITRISKINKENF